MHRRWVQAVFQYLPSSMTTALGAAAHANGRTSNQSSAEHACSLADPLDSPVQPAVHSQACPAAAYQVPSMAAMSAQADRHDLPHAAPVASSAGLALNQVHTEPDCSQASALALQHNAQLHVAKHHRQQPPGQADSGSWQMGSNSSAEGPAARPCRRQQEWEQGGTAPEQECLAGSLFAEGEPEQVYACCSALAVLLDLQSSKTASPLLYFLQGITRV